MNHIAQRTQDAPAATSIACGGKRYGGILVDRHSRWWLLLVPVAIALGAALATAWRAPQNATIDVSFAGLLDSDGAPADARPFAGRYLLVSFGFTSCPDVCPTTLLAVHRALDALGGDAERVAAVFVTLDPERDTPQRLKAYVRSFDPRIHAFTGTVQDVTAFATRFGVKHEKRVLPGSIGYTVDHTAMLYVVDPDGRVVAKIPESAAAPELSRQIVAAIPM